jgi:arsenate reductase
MTQPEWTHEFDVLFVCTDNASRSILAEAILNREGAGRFRAHSAGSMPAASVDPATLDALRALDYPTEGLRPKDWNAFAGPDAPDMDFIITLGDDDADEVCPMWPGTPMSAHWSLPDPAKVEGSDVVRHAATFDAYRMLSQQIGAFVSLPFAALDRASLHAHVHAIGQPDAS